MKALSLKLKLLKHRHSLTSVWLWFQFSSISFGKIFWYAQNGYSLARGNFENRKKVGVVKVVLSYLAFLCFLAERKPCLTNFSEIFLPNLKEFHRRKFEKSVKDLSIFSPQWQLRHQNRNSPRSLCEHARTFEPCGFVDEQLDNGGLIKIHTRPFRPNRFLYVFF